MEKMLQTREEQLFSRIQSEFEVTPLIGDIPINDEEFEILINYLNTKIQWLKRLKLKDINDRVLCVALVQIGIRCYDGAFWPYVARALSRIKSEFGTLPQQEQDLLGKSFFRTMNARAKYVLGASDRVYAILMQGFVCNKYASRFFDFLYAYYNIDLERDISRLDDNALNELIEVMKRTDNTGRTHQLVVQTAHAVRLDPDGAKARVKRFLHLIDQAFWNEPLPVDSTDRLTRRFLEWAALSEDIQSAQRDPHRRSKGKKLYSSPYYKLHISTGQVRLVLPPQLVRFSEQLDLAWVIRIGDRGVQLPINPYAQGVTGYKTDETNVILNGDEVLKECHIRLVNGNDSLRNYFFKEKTYRLFNTNGESIPSDHLQPGTAYSLSNASCIPVSNAMQMQKYIDQLCFCSYYLEDGDLICFPNISPISVGAHITNGLMQRGCVSGVRFIDNNHICPVYSSAPTLIMTLASNRIAGTAIIFNGRKYPLMREKVLLNGATRFTMNDGTDTVGIMLQTVSLGCSENGKYTLSVDSPGRSGVISYEFLVLKKFRFSFADAPYLFKTQGTLCMFRNYPLDHMEYQIVERTDSEILYKIDLTADSTMLKCNCCGFELEFDVPVFRYRFANEQWKIAAHIDIWHSAFQPLLDVQCPGTQITFSLDEYGNESEDEEEHEYSFTRTVSDQIFHCDLTRFSSWFGRKSAKRTIYVQCAGMEKKEIFLGVVTKSIFRSGELLADESGECLVGSFQIIGNAEYYADLFCGTKCLAEKVLLQEGQLTVKTKLQSGIYTVKIYEAEEDEYGFGSTYYEIGSREIQIIDPYDLSGKCVQIMQIQRLNEPDSYLRLYYNYLIVNLEKVKSDSNCYTGKMVVKTKGGTFKTSFPVYLTILDLHDLSAGYLEFDDDDEKAAFLYDSVERCLVKFADHRKGKSVIYRRYDPVLWTDEFVCKLSFVIPTAEELQCDVDDTEYNNLKYH